MISTAPAHQVPDNFPLQQGQGHASYDIPVATSGQYEDVSPTPAGAPAVITQTPVVVQVQDQFFNETNSRTSHFAAQSQQQQQQQQQPVVDPAYEHNVDFVDTPPDSSPVDTGKNRSVSGYTFTQFRNNVHDWHKKEFWIVALIDLAIMFAILGVEVFAPMASNGSVIKPISGSSG